jgi:hypothetical protein
MNEKKEQDEPVTFELSDEELLELAAQRSEVLRNPMLEAGKTPYTIENAPLTKAVRPRPNKPPLPIK